MSDLEIEADDDAIKFTCPDSMYPHCVRVFNGEYAAPGIDLGPNPVILDVGACVGAFSIWAKQTYPNAIIHAYEPNPAAHVMLETNIGKFATIHKVAVTEHESPVLFSGKNNLGEASIFKGREQVDTSVSVAGVDVNTLPECAFLKVDTEGCELSIIPEYLETHKKSPGVIAFEFHSHYAFKILNSLLLHLGMYLQHGVIKSSNRGVLVYARL